MWIGKKASPKEKQEAMRNAVGFLKKKDYPSDTKVTRVVEGAEPSDFKCLFRDWPQPAPTGKVYARSRIGEIVALAFVLLPFREVVAFVFLLCIHVLVWICNLTLTLVQ